MANQIDEEIIDVENAPQGGTVEVGARDPVTGQRFERFNPTINSTNLAPTAQADFNTPEELPVFPVDKIDLSAPTLEPTGTETQASDFSTQIQGLNEQLLGQSAFQSEQDQQAGVSEAQQTQTDLTSQLKAIQNEALAIPLQVQQESIGRGRTAGGVAPLQTARLRNNAIQALAVNSLLEASRGNLATAQAQADRAVAQKFDPIKEEIAVKTANLNLILQSPEYSRQQKNRAIEQQNIQNAKLKQVEVQEEQQRQIFNFGLDAAQKGADALTLQKIQQAKTPEEALQIMTSAGLFAEPEDFTFQRNLQLQGFQLITKEEDIPEDATEQDIFRDPQTGNMYLRPEYFAPEPDGSGVGDEIPEIPTPPTFEEFIAQKENQLQQSIADPESFRAEYDTLASRMSTPITKQNLIDVNGVDYVLRPDGTLETPNTPQSQVGGATSTENQLIQLDFLLDTIIDAKSVAGASGPSGIRKKLGDAFVGARPFTSLETFTDTLRTNVLTLATDPSIKKFFGPQMSEADVKLMTSAGSLLNVDNNTPEDMRAELIRLEDMFERMISSLPGGAEALASRIKDIGEIEEFEDEYNNIYIPNRKK